MTRITVDIPETQLSFFRELVKKLGFKISSTESDESEENKNDDKFYNTTNEQMVSRAEASLENIKNGNYRDFSEVKKDILSRFS